MSEQEPSSRPTSADLAAARERTIPDVVAPSLDVLFMPDVDDDATLVDLRSWD